MYKIQAKWKFCGFKHYLWGLCGFLEKGTWGRKNPISVLLNENKNIFRLYNWSLKYFQWNLEKNVLWKFCGSGIYFENNNYNKDVCFRCLNIMTVTCHKFTIDHKNLVHIVTKWCSFVMCGKYVANVMEMCKKCGFFTNFQVKTTLFPPQNTIW